MRARTRDGAFRTPFDPSASGYGTDYTEGNAWQYSWYVPQDVAGLAAAHGGADALLAQLDQVFDAKIDPKLFAHMEDITGLIGWYAHGNEPSHHVAYLYAAAGQPWRTQARLGADHAQPVRAAPRRAVGQRRPRADVGVVPVHRARLLPGDPGEQRVHHRPAVRAARARCNLPNGRHFLITRQRTRRRPSVRAGA